MPPLAAQAAGRRRRRPGRPCVPRPPSPPALSVSVSETVEPFTVPLTVSVPQVPLTASPLRASSTRTYAGSRSVGLVNSATHLPATSPRPTQGRTAAVTTTIPIQRKSTAISLPLGPLEFQELY